MRYFIDTEFDDDGARIELISIGVVAEDGRELYAVSTDADLDAVRPWVAKHVVPQLPPRDDPAWMPRTRIREGLVAFVGGDETPEFWATCSPWDWLMVVRLFGALADLPDGWPSTCWDLWQWAMHLGVEALPGHGGVKHDALEDARWHAKIYDFLASKR